MKDRIKKVRKDEKLTQDEFGARIGIKKSSISFLESGRNTPSDQTILAICREFHVREAWLRTGEEPMREVDEIDALVNRNNLGKATSAFLHAFENLPDEARIAALNALIAITDDIKAASQPPESPQNAPEGERVSIPSEVSTSGLSEAGRADVAEYARQRLLQEQAAAKSSASPSGYGPTAVNK